jgi:hypothetical protein
LPSGYGSSGWFPLGAQVRSILYGGLDGIVTTFAVGALRKNVTE